MDRIDGGEPVHAGGRVDPRPHSAAWIIGRASGRFVHASHFSAQGLANTLTDSLAELAQEHYALMVELTGPDAPDRDGAALGMLGRIETSWVPIAPAIAAAAELCDRLDELKGHLRSAGYILGEEDNA